MGQAQRRKQQLGDLYGTPEGSNRPLNAYQGFDQAELDQKALQQIRAALASARPIVLIGTKAACPLAAAAGLPWLHELPDGQAVPKAVAWDPEIAEAGGPLLPPDHSAGGVVVMGAGSSEWLARSNAAAG